MRKILLIAMGVLFFSNTTVGQNLKNKIRVSLTDQLDMSKKDYHLDIVELDNGEFIVIEGQFKDVTKTIQVVKFDKDFNEIRRNEIDMKFGDDKHRFKNLILAGGEVYVFTSFYDKKEKISYQLCQTLDQNTLDIRGDFKQLIQSNRDEVSTYKFSDDGSKIIYFRKKSAKKKEIVEYYVKVLDAKNGFQTIWDSDFTSDQINKLEDIESYDINNDGTAYFMTLLFKDERRNSKKDGEPNYVYRLKEFSNKGKSVKAYDLELGDKFISDITFGINGSNNIVCTGFYSELSSFAIKGSFYMLFDYQTKSVTKKSTKEFGLDFITENLSERQTKKVNKKAAKGKDIELPNYELKGLVMEDNGSVVQIAERYYVESHTHTDQNGRTYTTYTYHTDEILVTRINEKGEIDWIRKIRKAQSSKTPSNIFASFHFALLGDKMYFIHNGNSKNMVLEQKEAINQWRLGKKAATIITEIDLEGFMNKDILMDFAGYQQIPWIRTGLNLSNGDVLFFCSEKKKDQYIRVSIDH